MILLSALKFLLKKRELHIEIQIIFISNKIKVTYSMFDYEIYAYLIKKIDYWKNFLYVSSIQEQILHLESFLEPNSHQYSTINLVLVCASFASPKSLPHCLHTFQIGLPKISILRSFFLTRKVPPQEYLNQCLVMSNSVAFISCSIANASGFREYKSHFLNPFLIVCSKSILYRTILSNGQNEYYYCFYETTLLLFSGFNYCHFLTVFFHSVLSGLTR